MTNRVAKKSAAKQPSRKPGKKPMPQKVPGHLAIRSAHIQNFRGFADARLDDIRRVNIVVGDNGTGKTALLEALFSAAVNSPVFMLQFRQWRGLPTGGQMSTDGRIWEYFSRDLFHDYDMDKDVILSIKRSDNYERTLRIFRNSKPVFLPLGNGEDASQSIHSPISFEWKESNQKKATVITPEMNVQDNKLGISIPTAPSPGIKGNFLQGAIHPQPELFSNLKIKGEAAPFLREIQAQFPDIEDMSVESEYGNSMIFMKQKSHKKLIPVNLISGGFSKIVSVLLSLSSNPSGFLFVDELDNGIYFGRHELFWKQITEFSRTYESQMFASVHSREFLEAVLPAMRKCEEEFSIIRVYRQGGVSKVAIISGQGIVNLLESGLEIRG